QRRQVQLILRPTHVGSRNTLVSSPQKSTPSTSRKPAAKRAKTGHAKAASSQPHDAAAAPAPEPARGASAKAKASDAPALGLEQLLLAARDDTLD
ncbi:MAG: hypothetical protein AAF471_08660, partial [Myxococcota bacterium]